MSTRGWQERALITTLGICVALLSSVASPPVSAGNDYASPTRRGACKAIGTLRLAGAGRVTLNERPAADRTPLCSEDRIATGAASGAIVLFERGGYVQFDENTDPIFRVIQELVVEVIGLNTGQIFAQSPPGGKIRVTGSSGDAETRGTEFNLRLKGGLSVLTVVRGQVNLRRPEELSVYVNQQVGYGDGRVAYRRALSKAEVTKLTEWRFKYPLTAGNESRSPPTTSSQRGVPQIDPRAAFEAGRTLWEIFDHNRDRTSREDRPDRYPDQGRDDNYPSRNDSDQYRPSTGDGTSSDGRASPFGTD